MAYLILNRMKGLANDRRRKSYIGSIKVDGVLTNEEKKNGIVAFFRTFFNLNNKELLLQKKDCIEVIKDLRPISLIHEAYKIVSKILAERFKVTLPAIISRQQSTFVKKRQILDGVLVADELIDSRIRSGKPGLLCKVDFEKAFDHVNWNLLDDMFNLMGFGEKWKSWIKCYVEYVIFSVLVNGSATGYFKRNKGIRQGDPILPFLFLLVEEALAFMIKKAQEEGLISGFQTKEDGIMINFAKSLIFRVAYDSDLTIFSSLLGCHSGTLPTTYLSFPLGDKCCGVDKWDRIIEKFISKLAGWKKILLSRAGKITLINSVLSSIPIYYMSLFEMHVSVIKKLEKIMRDFLWNYNKGKKKIHLVKWRTLCIRKNLGGLGIKSLKKMNKALLSKWTWRFAVEDGILWKAIVSENMVVKMLNGFQKPLNACTEPIKTSYPNLYALSRARHLSVAEICNTDGPAYSWNLQVPTRLNVAARTEYHILMLYLSSFRFNNLKCPPKVGFFFWLIAYNRFPTRDLLTNRGIEVPATCVFCNSRETSAYLLLHCSFATDVWNNFLANLKWFCSVHMDIIPSLQACNLPQLNAAT
ncbi:uncharacterized protein LOC113272807 [Papaver somniferum]|uniref:uncharacterized protein LOC113272807 n=1 Tax=Papaver somniferum TaxID=3469 RepID=UPI000E6F6C6B|nr:uncharacterized protein LOC113272807 [Papaver somniferum]